MFIGGEVGPHPHVERNDFPLGVAVGAWRADIVAVSTVLGPELSARRPGRLAGRGSRGCGGAACENQTNGGHSESGQDCQGA